jgi:signal transduction histidine kinase/CheY-like chemotaxis protein
MDGDGTVPQNAGMQPLSIWRRTVLLLRGQPFGFPLLAGALALLLAVGWVSILGRGLLDPVDAASQATVRQRLLVAEHDRATLALVSLHEALLRASARGRADAALLRPLAELNEAVEALATRVSAIPPSPSTRVADDTFTMLRNLSRLFQNLDDDVRASRPVPAAMLARSVDAMAQLLRFGQALRQDEANELLRQQSVWAALHARAQWLAWLPCLLFALLAALAIHAAGVGRRGSLARSEADAALQRAVAADELAAAAGRGKSKFLGMLSHELLTPLQSIVSSMDIIESKGRVDVGDPVFMRLREGARALRARMSDLVDFAKMSAGRLAVNPRKFRIDRLVEDVIADHEEAVVRKDLDIHWEPGAVAGQPVLTDPRRVRQILDNLVSNAIKYTARGGITIEAEVPAGSGHLRLAVRDTGIGIAPDMLDHIFEPFFRIASSSQLAEGSGLGLAVVHSLVELLQGRIEVESTLGEGTRFLVEIPLGALTLAAPAMAAVPAGGEVLIVDDAHDARAVIASIVRELGYFPAEAGSAGEALRALSERRYAAVLLDIELPDQSGFDVIRQVRNGSGPNRDGFFVMLSASHEADEAAALFNVRAEKPIQAPQLKALLQQGS